LMHVSLVKLMYYIGNIIYLYRHITDEDSFPL
jgi:hypothetical protein